MLYGSIVVTLLALAAAVPLGIMAAIFTSQVLPAKWHFTVKSLLELLAGIPSILYGLIGVALLSVNIETLFGLQSGRTLFTAGILLAVMVLPTIMTLTDDALRRVPRQYRETAAGLGLYPHEIIWHVLMPIAKADIIGAILLALGRALGETMAVMLIIGGIDRIPQPFYNILSPGQTLTSKLGRELTEAAFGSPHFSALIFMGLILLMIVLICTLLAHLRLEPQRRLHE